MIPAPSPLEIETFFKVVAAVVLSGFVGLERERAEKPAGFRTHMIIGGAAALLVMLGIALLEQYPEVSGGEGALRYDPLRVIEAIIVGVSFIGAGTILKREEKGWVSNLTTAASLLFSAGIGICSALGLFYLAVGLTVLILTINLILNWLSERFIEPRSEE